MRRRRPGFDRVSPGPRSKSEEVPRTARTFRRGMLRWTCRCPDVINARYLVNCLDCGARRDVDGTPVEETDR